jgi:alpha-2-macroglobulin
VLSQKVLNFIFILFNFNFFKESDKITNWWNWSWYEHQNFRDERVEAFASMLWEGVHDYSFVCRATSKGEFFVPPATAEEMYSPEIFGRSNSEKVIII